MGYQDTGLTPKTTYDYQVAAYNTGGYTFSATYAEITTPSSTVPPNAPTGLGGYANSTTSVTFTWSEVTPPPVDLYFIYRWTGSAWANIGVSLIL